MRNTYESASTTTEVSGHLSKVKKELEKKHNRLSITIAKKEPVQTCVKESDITLILIGVSKRDNGKKPWYLS